MLIKRFFATILDIFISLCAFFAGILICGVFGAMTYGIIYPDVEQVPEPWSSRIVYLSFTAGIVYAVFVWRRRRKKLAGHPATILSNDTEESSSKQVSKKLPSSKKKQLELASSILGNIEACVSLANKTDCISLFIKWYDESIDGFEILMRLDKVKFQNSPSIDYYRFKDEFQWHLCDAIVRAKESTISDINDKYKNSREFQLRAMNAFEYDINGARDRFSEDTAVLADNAIAEIREIVESKITPVYQKPSANSTDQFAKYGGVDAELLSIDLMEGHTFEHWCAQLLSDIGFINVRVTRASGDQGVDVLAEKDGIKFAIQCKCYSRDLDNKPVQEVNAGKSMPEYHCQIGAVMTNRYFTQSAQAAAAANDVLLWDRDWIRNAICQRNENSLMLQHQG